MSKELADFVEKSIAQTIWVPAGIDETPEIRLARWSVREVIINGEVSRHFVGENLTEGYGRVSSAIQEFDRATMRGRTASGRIYELVGNPGRDSDAEYTWGSWKMANEVTEERDVSGELQREAGA